MRAIKLLAALPVILALLIPLTAHAIDQPDNSDLIQASNGYTNLLEQGDLLVVTEYDIQYATTPTDYRSDEAFFIQLLNSGTTIAVNTLYPYFESGYQEGVASVYLTAAETLNLGLTNSDGEWASWGPATFSSRIVGNPIVWATVPSDSQNLTTSDFSSNQTKVTNEDELHTRVMEIARTLEGAWVIDLISTDPEILSDEGSRYFPLAIPELFRMVQGIQLISTLPAEYPTPVPIPGTFATASEDRYSDTTWIQGGFDSLSTDTGIPSIALRAIVMMILAMIVIGLGAYHLGSMGGLMGFVGVLVIGIPIFVSQGFLPWAFAIFIAALVTLFGFLRMSGRLET